ncbi:MAG: class I SAM-dependent methyltransferase [Anaerolineae bacterium]|nr:class I SAM-dependent methyltransferase [Anaerolineae bacterium]MCB0212168.1 class I SAM-dependent methyltransferase [Anaerolineae bacterium]
MTKQNKTYPDTAFEVTNKTNIVVESRNICPVCGGNGDIFLTDCQDFIYGMTGRWTFQKCRNCYSLWLNPCPVRKCIPDLYPEQYYTHDQASPLLRDKKTALARLTHAAKLAILEKKFGYRGLTNSTDSPIGIKLGWLLSYLPIVTNRAGYTIRFIRSCPQGKLLEVGVGNGGYGQLMQSFGWQVDGIEPDAKAAQVAKERGLNVQIASVEEADIPLETYDAVVLHHVMEHIPDPKAAIHKLLKSLKPGGTLVSISPNPVGAIARTFSKKWYALDPPRHLVLPSPQGYQAMVAPYNIQVNISTTTQISFWMLRESLSIKQTGNVGQYHAKHLPLLGWFLCTLFLPVFPTIGEEVVCVVTKT